MKKLTTILAAATMFAFVACGPSAKEAEEAAKAKADSIANVEAAAAEVMAAAAQDSITAAAEKAKMDSTTQAAPTTEEKK